METTNTLIKGVGFDYCKDAEEAALPLPRTYGTDDIPLILTSRNFPQQQVFLWVEAYS
jgi:hypothetical protein